MILVLDKLVVVVVVVPAMPDILLQLLKDAACFRVLRVTGILNRVEWVEY